MLHPYFLLIYIILGLIRKSTSVYVGGTNSRMRNKLVALDKELTLDAITNVRRIQHFKDELYEQHDAFHIGKLLVKIRSKFGRMVRIHALSHANLDTYKKNVHILHLAEVQHLAMDIDNLVDIILDFEWEGKPKKMSYKKVERYRTPGAFQNMTIKPPPKRMLRSPFAAAPGHKVNIWRNNPKITENNGGGFESDINK